MPTLEEIFASPAHHRFRNLGEELKLYLYEREQAIELVQIAFLIRHHVLLVSRPGTAKSLLLDLMCRAIKGARFFGTEVYKLTPPDFIFGPWDIAYFEEKKEQRYKTEGYLPAVHFALIDEFYSANAQVLIGAASILNPGQRWFSNGNRREPCPIHSVVAGTNHIPDFSEEFELGKMHDRFLFRMELFPIKEKKNFLSLLRQKPPRQLSMEVTLAELENLQSFVPQVVVPHEVDELNWALRKKVDEAGIEVSDRRWQWTTDALKGRAFLARRKEVEIDDLLILMHILWSDPAREKEKVRDLILAVAFPRLFEAMTLRKSAEDALKLAYLTTAATEKRREQVVEIGKIRVRLVELLAGDARAGIERDGINFILGTVVEIEKRILEVVAQIHPEEG